MPFEIVRNDITNMRVDAIVNTANPCPVIGSGTDSMIHKKAGPELLTARQKIGKIDRGCAAMTPAFDLQAKYVIRTAVSLGGDCDTLTCIAGAMAEGFYGVPVDLKRQCRSRLDQQLLGVLERFDFFLKGNNVKAIDMA